MDNFSFYAPTYFEFGKGAEAKTGALVKRFGGSKVLIHWWLVAVGSVCTFAWLLPQHPDLAMPPINALLLGIMPSLIFCGIADFTTLPESVTGQIIHAILFGVFSVLMLFNSADILAPAYGFLLAQVQALGQVPVPQQAPAQVQAQRLVPVLAQALVQVQVLEPRQQVLPAPAYQTSGR